MVEIFGSLSAGMTWRMSMIDEEINSFILSLESARIDAFIRADQRALDGLLSDELVYVHADGSLDSKSTLVAKLANRSIVYQSMDLEDLSTKQLSSEIIFINGKYSNSGLNNGDRFEITVVFLACWHLVVGDRWQFNFWRSFRVL